MKISNNRILKNLGANSVSSILNVLFQVISVPICLKFWGVAYYGEWLVLSATTAYVAIADFGVVTTVSNEFVMSFSKGRYNMTKTLFSSGLAFLLCIFLVEVSLFFMAYMLIDLQTLLNINLIDSYLIILFLVILHGFAQLFINFYDSVYKAHGLSHKAVMQNNYIKIFESLFFLCAVGVGLPIINVVTVFVLPKIIGVLYKIRAASLLQNNLVGFEFIDMKVIFQSMKVALGYVSLSVGNVLKGQFILVVINATVGSTAVVLLSTTRTFLSLMNQATNLISNSFNPEFTLAFGSTNRKYVKGLVVKALSISFYVSLILALFIMSFGSYIYSIWLKGNLIFNPTFTYLLVLSGLLASFWTMAGSFLASTNNHVNYGKMYLLGSCGFVTISYALLLFVKDITLLPIVYLFLDTFMLYHVIKEINKVGDVSLIDVFKYIMIMPKMAIVKARGLLE